MVMNAKVLHTWDHVTKGMIATIVTSSQKGTVTTALFIHPMCVCPQVPCRHVFFEPHYGVTADSKAGYDDYDDIIFITRNNVVVIMPPKFPHMWQYRNNSIYRHVTEDECLAILARSERCEVPIQCKQLSKKWLGEYVNEQWK